MLKKSFLFASVIYLFNSIGNVMQGILIKYYQGALSLGLYNIITIKCLIACIIMLPFSIKYLRHWRKDLHIVFILSLLYSMDLLLCNTGFKTVPVNTGILILLLIPLWIVVLSRILLNEKSFNWINAVALIVCLVGVFIPIRKEISFGGFNIGYIYLFFASIIIPLRLLLQKKFTDCRPIPYALFTNAFVLGLISFILSSFNLSFANNSLSIVFDVLWLKDLNFMTLVAGLLIAVCDLVEFSAVYFAYAITEAALLQPIRFTRIIISMLFSWLILSEKPTYTQVIGAILIIVSNLISIVYSKKYQDKK